jgi:hypothetical protein
MGGVKNGVWEAGNPLYPSKDRMSWNYNPTTAHHRVITPPSWCDRRMEHRRGLRRFAVHTPALARAAIIHRLPSHPARLLSQPTSVPPPPLAAERRWRREKKYWNFFCMANVGVTVLKKVLDPNFSLNKCWFNFLRKMFVQPFVLIRLS